MWTTQHGRVVGLDDVYAAGDMTEFPIKQGGLAAQQADAVAEAIAAAAGAGGEATPFRPVLRGMLLIGRQEHFLTREISGGNGEGETSAQPLWWPPTKIAGRYLAPYLYARDEASQPPAPPGPHVPVEISLGQSRERDTVAR